MAEYIERSVAIDFVKNNTPTIDGETLMQCVVMSLVNAPTADVVEVVRWKDCKYCEMCFPCKGYGLEALPVYVCCLGHRNREVLPNDYCSMGAKMDGKGEGE